MSAHLRMAWRRRIAYGDVGDPLPPGWRWSKDENGDPALVQPPEHYGPVMTEAQAQAQGWYGPVYHGTTAQNAASIRQRGFRSKGLEDYELNDWGTIEEVLRGDTIVTWFTEDLAAAKGYGDVVVAYLRPGHYEPMAGVFTGEPALVVDDVVNAAVIVNGRTAASTGPLYHGSFHDLPVGTILAAGIEPGNWTNSGQDPTSLAAKLVWLTDDPDDARSWAVQGAKERGITATPRVYEVEPMGELREWKAPDPFRLGIHHYTVERARVVGIRSTANWRAQQVTDFWNLYDAVIATDRMGSRRSFDVWTLGQNIAQRPSLAEAKAAVEDVYGPLPWRRVTMPPVVYNHYYFGPTTEMTDPTTILVVDHLPKLRAET